MTGVSEHLHCALCDSKILEDDQKVACGGCGKYMCSYCGEATRRCCVDDQPPVLSPVSNSHVCREVEEISFQVLAIVFFLLVIAPAFQWWCMQENHRFMRSRLTDAQYEELCDYDRVRMIRMRMN